MEKKISELTIKELEAIVRKAMNPQEGNSLKSKIKEMRQRKELDALEEEEQRRNAPTL
jgi:hypothetical protein